MNTQDHRKPTAVLAAAFVLLASAESPAQQDSPEIEAVCAGERLEFERPSMSTFDTDGNRLISGEEAAECETLAFLFSRLDLDASRTLTSAEYDGFPQLWRRYARTFQDPE